MTVRCPQCDTAYRMPPRSRLGAHPTFRCSRCEHVFDPEETLEEPELIDDGLEGAEIDEPEPVLEDGDSPGPTLTTARFAVRSAVAVTLTFALLSIYLYTHRGRVTDLVAGLPMVGTNLAGAPLDPGDIQLTDVHGQYVRVQGDRLVFVISGTAVNNAPVPVGAIQIEGRIIGAHEQHQLVFAGAAPRSVEDLSEQEIDLLQTLEPPGNWRLLPGEEGGFLVAFVNPPPLREFSTQVVAARRRASAPARTSD
jgi:predicted Zn finger-like uncharacterized protein